MQIGEFRNNEKKIRQEIKQDTPWSSTGFENIAQIFDKESKIKKGGNASSFVLREIESQTLSGATF